MEIIRESSDPSETVTARQISAEKPFTDPEICYNNSIQPDFESYYLALNPYIWVVWSCGLAALIGICALFIVTMRASWQHWRQRRTNITVVLALYPIIASSSFLAIVLPRGRILAESIAQEAVMVAMYHLFGVIVAECGGAEQLIGRHIGLKLDTRVLPCCCWPCCIIPRPKLKKKSLRFITYLVMQMPISHAFIYIILLAMRAEDMVVYEEYFIYVQLFVVTSILSGSWGMMMCIRMAEQAGHRIRLKYFAIKLAFIIIKVQRGLATYLPQWVTIPCVASLNPSVYINLIQNTITILEMLLLSVWAWCLYRVPPGNNLDGPQVVSNIKAIDFHQECYGKLSE